MLVGVNEDATFKCQVTGEPMPEVQWLFNGVPIDDDEHHKATYVNEDDTHRLVIVQTTPVDSGKYTVVAKNDFGKSICTAELLVERKLIILNIITHIFSLFNILFRM